MQTSTINIAKTLFTADNPSAFLELLEMSELKAIVDFFAEYIPEACDLNSRSADLTKDLIIRQIVRIVDGVQARLDNISKQETVSIGSRTISRNENQSPDGFSIHFAKKEHEEALNLPLPSDRKSHFPFAKFYAYLGAQATALGREFVLRKIEELYSNNQVIILSDGTEVSAKEVIGYYNAGEHEVEGFSRKNAEVSQFTRIAGNKTWYISPLARGAVSSALDLLEYLPENRKDWLTPTKIGYHANNCSNVNDTVIEKINNIFLQLYTIKDRKITVEVDGVNKSFLIGDLVSQYKRPRGTTNYCSPLLLDFFIKTLDMPKKLPGEHSWLNVEQCCKELKMRPDARNKLKVKSFYSRLLAEKGDELVALPNGEEARVNELVGRYVANRASGYYIREDAIGVIINKSDIVFTARAQEESEGKSNRQYIPSSRLIIMCALTPRFDNVYAVRKLLQELYEGTRHIEGITPDDIHMVSGADRGKGDGNDVYYIKSDKAGLITAEAIKDRTKDIKLWELELLQLASQARSNPEKLRAA